MGGRAIYERTKLRQLIFIGGTTSVSSQNIWGRDDGRNVVTLNYWNMWRMSAASVIHIWTKY